MSDPNRSRLAPLALTATIVVLALGLEGCATLPPGELARGDPWERFNRQVFSFNEIVDKAAIKPAAQIYQTVVPNLVRTGVNNMFSNVGDGWTAVNLMLQVKPVPALNMAIRTATNTVLGIGGLFDVAEEAGLERTASEDFGQTLGFWGVQSGPYLMLPLLGPSTLRDTAAMLLDINETASNVLWKEPRDRNAATGLQILNTRVNLLNAGRVLDEIALDKYLLLRDAYLARRRSQIYDGEPPEDSSQSAPSPFKQLGQ